MTQRLVPGYGKRHARLVIIGEAPGYHESEQGRPFVGPSGWALQRWWKDVGLAREDFYLTNVVKFRPTANKIETVSKAELAEAIEVLHNELAGLEDPWLIVPVGNTALRALLGFASILKHRGSIYSYEDRRGRSVKVIGTLHPAAVLRSPYLEKRVRADWQRIADEAQFRDVRLPHREHVIRPTLRDCQDFLADARRADALAIDIETPREREVEYTEKLSPKCGTCGHKRDRHPEGPCNVGKGKKKCICTAFVELQLPGREKVTWGQARITCVGFATSPTLSLTIPTTRSYWRDRESLAAAWRCVQQLCELRAPKVLQNGHFDTWWLAQPQTGVRLANWYFDTLAQHHCLDPADDHDLAFMASVYTKEPYWKCLKGDTEVLTPHGWVRLAALTKPQDILAYDAGRLQWERAEPRQTYFRGEGIRVDALRHHCWYTPNHKLVFEDVQIQAQQAFGWSGHLVTGGMYEGSTHAPVLLCLIAAIQADGHIEWRNTKTPTVHFNLKKQRKIDRLRSLVARAGCTLNEYAGGAKRNRLECDVQGDMVGDALAFLGKQKLFDNWLLSFDRVSLRAFLEELQYWDGWQTFNGHALNYSSKHKQNIDWAATVAHFLGYTAHPCALGDGKWWKVSFKKQDHVRVKSRHWSTEAHDGPVYCVTVPSGAFLARANDHIFVTGNSDGKLTDDTGSDQLTRDLDVYWRYNGKDACVTYELAEVFDAELHRRKLTDFYERHYVNLFQPLLDLMLEGVCVDDAQRRLRLALSQVEVVQAQDALTLLAGEPLYGKSDLSNKKLCKFLYDTLKLPRQFAKGPKGADTKSLTANEVAVRRLALKYPTKFGPAAEHILTHRRQSKLGTFLQEKNADADGRLRCSYKFTTETGRLASGKNPGRTGANLQNQDREIRAIYTAEPDCVFVECDLSQAESRVVGVLTGDPKMIQLARTPPWEFDVHKYNASKVFGKPVESITKVERYLGKRAIHASNYGMGGGKLSEVLLLDGHVYTPEQCQRLIDNYLNEHPAIPGWHRATRALVMRDRALANPFGRVIDFTYDRLADDLFRRAYAFIPQSSVADILNQWGLVPLWRWLKAEQMRSRIRLQVHDALVVACPPDEAWDVYSYLKQSLERPLTYWGTELTIPADVKVGRNWRDKSSENPAGLVEFKRPPEREEFESVVAEVMRT